MTEAVAITTETSATASAVGSSRIREFEAVIERGLHTFIEVGFAHWEISEHQFYREQGYNTFEEYCKKRWSWSPKTAYQHIQAYEAAGNVQTSGQVLANVSQAALLAPLPEDQQREVASRVNLANTSVRKLKEEIQRVKNPESEANKTYLFKPKSLRKPLTEKLFTSEIRRITRGYLRCHRTLAEVRVVVQDNGIQVDICMRNANGQQRGAA